MDREEYKKKFLIKRSDIETKKAIRINRSTRSKLVHLSYGGVGNERIPIGDIVENIIEDHINENLETIKEIYKHDSPLY